MFGLILANHLFVTSLLASCCRLFFLPLLDADLLLAITILLWSQAALMGSCSDRVDRLNKRQQKAMLLPADRSLPDEAKVSRGI